MSDNSGLGLVIAIGFLSLSIGLILINLNLQKQNDLICQNSETCKAESISSSISQSISSSISAQSYSEYCSSIESVSAGNVSQAESAVGANCPGGLPWLESYLLPLVAAVGIIAVIISWIMGRGY